MGRTSNRSLSQCNVDSLSLVRPEHHFLGPCKTPAFASIRLVSSSCHVSSAVPATTPDPSANWAVALPDLGSELRHAPDASTPKKPCRRRARSLRPRPTPITPSMGLMKILVGPEHHFRTSVKQRLLDQSVRAVHLALSNLYLGLDYPEDWSHMIGFSRAERLTFPRRRTIRQDAGLRRPSGKETSLQTSPAVPGPARPFQLGWRRFEGSELWKPSIRQKSNHNPDPAKGLKSICHLELIDPSEEVINPDETGSPVFPTQ